MDHLIIGTAGHVDHGKTVLIKGITGIDTDRLQEEKKRGISIDLGFAPFRLPGGRMAGVVDVPGHERFIHNMLAGAAGMDLVLLVVDANEGIMPQTREHLSILGLMGVKKGIVVITKIDLVDREWEGMVREDLRAELKGTFLESAPICAVSALKGQGMDRLKELIDKLTLEVKSRNAGGPLRLPVDRSFSIPGFGTVVTGTLFQGTVRAGDMVSIVPPGLEARVRNIQVHDQDEKEAGAGQRVALNLSGIEKSKILRGSVVGSPGFFRPTSLLDVSVVLLPQALRALNNMDPVHFFLGTARTVARLFLLDRDELLPGEKAPAQCRLERPLVADRADSFIVRSYSPMTTIGGGKVLDPFPARHRRYRSAVLESLQELEKEQDSGSGEAFVRQKLHEEVIAKPSHLAGKTRLGEELLVSILEELVQKGQVEKLGRSYLTRDNFLIWKRHILGKLQQHHSQSPLSPGIPRAELKGALPGSPGLREYDIFLERLQEEKEIAAGGEFVRLYGFKPMPDRSDIPRLEKLKISYHAGWLQPPGVIEALESAGLPYNRMEEIMSYLVNEGALVKVREELYFCREAYMEAVELLRSHFAVAETLTLAQFRDITGSSRKYCQALLEHFDRCKITRRIEDHRVPGKQLEA